jgi:putative MATE family efflux protein
MYSLIAVNLLYLTIAYPLVYGLWGFPAWGITGAAVATGIAEGSGVAYLLWTCRKLFKTSLNIRRDLLRSTWQIGASVSGERIFQQAGIILYTKIVLLYGTVTYAAHQVGLSIESLSFLPGYGFAIAAATMVGQSIGAGKFVRAKLENWEANRLASMTMAAMGIFFFFFPYILLRAFTNDETVVELGTMFLRIVAILQVPLALTMVLAGSLRGAGDTRFIMWTTTIGMWGVRLPLAVIAGPWLALDVLFVWSAMIADWTVRMVLLLVRYRSERWKAIQVIR